MKLLIVGGNATLQRSISAACRRLAEQPTAVASSSHGNRDAASAQLEPRAFADSGSLSLDDALHGVEVLVALDSSLASHPSSSRDPARTVDALVAARRAGVRRIVLVMAPGPDDARLAALVEAARTASEWLAIRVGTIYGLGDDPLSLFLTMMRSLPVVPLLNDTHVVQPLWHEDLAQAIARAATLPAEMLARTIDVAGPERLTPVELYDRISALTDRRPLRVPVPDFLASLGLPSQAVVALGNSGDLAPDAPRMLHDFFGLTPTTIEDGLRRHIQQLEELTPLTGVGGVEVKRFYALIAGSRHDAPSLLTLFRTRFAEVMPISVGVEPAAPETVLVEGSVLTMALPGRGHVQVRVEEVRDDHVIVGTLRGHVVAGIVRFSAAPLSGRVRFEVMTCDSAANAADWLSLTLGGARLQDANWTRVVEKMVTLSGGDAPEGVQHDMRKLSDEEAAAADRWISQVIARRRAQSDEQAAEPS